MIISLGIMLALYLPDWIGRYSGRDSTFQSFFASFIGIAAGVVAVIAFIMKAMANTRWTFDADQDIATCWIRTAFGREFEDQLELQHVGALALKPPDGLLSMHRIVVQFADGGEATVASCRFGVGELRDIHRTLTKVLAPRSS